MKSNDWRHKNVAPYTPGNTKILYFFNCLLDGMHTTIPYICDFSRCRLNVRLTARIQPLLRGHKYRVSAFFGSCLLAAHANSEFILRKIWGRLQTVVAFWKIEILEDWHLSYHFKLFDIITIFGRFPGFIHLPYNFFAFFSIFTANWSVRIVGMVFQTRSS